MHCNADTTMDSKDVRAYNIPFCTLALRAMKSHSLAGLRVQVATEQRRILIGSVHSLAAKREKATAALAEKSHIPHLETV